MIKIGFGYILVEIKISFPLMKAYKSRSSVIWELIELNYVDVCFVEVSGEKLKSLEVVGINTKFFRRFN